MPVYASRPLSVGFLVFAGLACATASHARADSLNMKVNGWTNPPVGYLEFCRNFPTQCVSEGQDNPEAISDQTWRDLQEVNTLVNHIISPATDFEIYHRDEVWTLPQTYGDCEDYALLKRKLLVDRGWPTGSLLMTVVFDEVGDGHAVLLARTSRGDFVLDNKNDKLKHWYETGYRYVKRQSVGDPNRWVSVGDPRSITENTATSR